jgi:hypothetical protein
MGILLALLTIICAVAFSPLQALIVRNVLKQEGVDPFTTVTDAVMGDGLAFTDSTLKRIFIDFNLYKDAPTSLANTVKHEVAHTKGRQHNEIPGDIMSYRATTNLQGQVVDDPYFWG